MRMHNSMKIKQKERFNKIENRKLYLVHCTFSALSGNLGMPVSDNTELYVYFILFY